jgi:hypothetical protein
MPTYGVGSDVGLVVGGTKVEVEVVSRRVEEGVVDVVVEVATANPNLDRTCQFHGMGGMRSRTTRISL